MCTDELTIMILNRTRISRRDSRHKDRARPRWVRDLAPEVASWERGVAGHDAHCSGRPLAPRARASLGANQ